MSTNKNAIIRYMAIDRCLKNTGRKYAINDLLKACNTALLKYDSQSGGIAKRQLYNDIRFMKSLDGYNAPIETKKEGKYSFYYYSDPDYSISNSPINETEATQIAEALSVLKRFQGLPQFEWIYELTPKINEAFNIDHDYDREIISFEENRYLVGKEHIGPIFNAIHYKRTLEIDYKSFKNSSDIALTISPYFLKQYNNRWFAFGKSQEYKDITTLALDRIKSVKEVQEPYEETTIDFSEYFEDVIGVTVVDDDPVEIYLKFSSEQAPYIKTKPLHGSQKLKEETDRYIIITIEVIPNFELYKTILSYGSGVEVLSPENVRKKLSDIVKKVNNIYKCAD